MSVRLVLEGGAMRGMYTAGVLDVFLDNGIKADTVIGVSAGAVFGINFLSEQRGRVIRYNKQFVGDSRYMGLKSLIKTGDIINKEFAYYQVPAKYDVFDDEKFKRSDTDFYAVVTNIESGKAEYIKIDSTFEQTEILRASASWPYVSKAVEINGKKYLDGGLADSIPVDKCMKIGLNKIILVLTRPLDYRKKEGRSAKHLLAKAVYRKYPELIKCMNTRNKRYNQCVEKIIELEKQKKIFVIRPSRTVKLGRMETDKEKLQEMYDLGVRDGKKRIGEMLEFLSDK